MNGGGTATTTRRTRTKSTSEQTTTSQATSPIIPSKVPYTVLTGFSTSTLPSSYAYNEEVVTTPQPLTSTSSKRPPTIVTLSSVTDEEKFLEEVVR